MFFLKLTVLAVCIASPVALAQDLTIPTAWSGAVSSDSRAVREAYANGAAQALVASITIDGSLPDQTDGQALASMYSTLALQDLLSGNKTWEKAVTASIQAWIGQHDVYGNGTEGSQRTNTNCMHWALAFYYAYKAYGQQSFLTLAQQSWDATYTYFITSDMVNNPQASLPPTRNSSWLNLKPEYCFNDGSIGGVFLLPDVSDSADIRTETVAPFSILAGHLYEETQNETYKDTGLLSLDCMSGGLMFVTNTNLIWGVVNPQQCNWDWPQSCGFQGWYIHALSIWANITGDPAGNLTERLRRVVSTTANSTDWTTTDGVLLDPDTGVHVSDNLWDDKAILVRGLSELLRRLPDTSVLTNYTQAFLANQYTALIKNARVGNNYSTSLTGPTPRTYTSNGNIVALDVLNAAFDLLPPDNGTLASQSPSMSTAAPSKSPEPSSSRPVGAIVGGVIGGLAVLGMLIGAILWYRHIQHSAMPSAAITDKVEAEGIDGTVAPFLSYAHDPGNLDDIAGPISRTVRYTSATANPKLQRMNALPQPSPPVSYTTDSLDRSEESQSDARSHASPATSDIVNILRGVVHTILRDHGAVPPEYEC